MNKLQFESLSDDEKLAWVLKEVEEIKTDRDDIVEKLKRNPRYADIVKDK